MKIVKKELKNNHKPSLMDFGIIENEHHFWLASWYAKILGYKSLKTLTPSIDKAKRVCLQMGIPIDSNFISFEKDIKLSKFACFLIALQADGKKAVVKRARLYFLNELEEINILLDSQDFINRILGQEQIKNLNKNLAKAARRAHVKDFQFFMNEGYLGLYNHTVTELKKMRAIGQNKKLTDYMSMSELAANIFRISLTTERLKYLRNPTEQQAAKEHWKVGTQIRSIMKESTGAYPEFLDRQIDLKTLQSKLKLAQKELNKVVEEKLVQARIR